MLSYGQPGGGGASRPPVGTTQKLPLPKTTGCAATRSSCHSSAHGSGASIVVPWVQRDGEERARARLRAKLSATDACPARAQHPLAVDRNECERSGS